MIFEKRAALAAGRCVCSGYAGLLDHAYKELGLESREIIGNVRLLDGAAQWDPRAWQAGHAWNAVKLHGEWKLIDATWASGSVSGTIFKKERADSWFFMPPELFLLSHFPFKQEFQLVAKPITKEEFYQQAYLLWDFGQSGIDWISKRQLILGGEPGDIIRIVFRSTKEISHVVFTDRDDYEAKRLPVKKKDDLYYVNYIVGSLAKGSYYFGVLYSDDKRRIYWRADRVLGYFLDYKEPGAFKAEQ